MSGYLTGILAILSLNVILAYAVFLPVAAGQLNLGVAGFQCIGAYAAAYLSAVLRLPMAVSIPAAALAGAAVALAIALPVLRTRGVYLTLATLAFAEVTAGAIINVDALGGAMGLPVRAHVGLVPIAAAAAACMALVALLMGSRFGLAMRAIHDDETVADLLGIEVRATRVAAFTLGGLLAGLAGGLYAHYFNFVETQTFDATGSIYVLLFVLLGGTQTAWGPLIGAGFFTLLPELMRSAMPLIAGLLGGSGGTRATELDTSWRFVVLGLITIAMMIARPEGIVTRTLLELAGRRRPPGSGLPERA